MSAASQSLVVWSVFSFYWPSCRCRWICPVDFCHVVPSCLFDLNKFNKHRLRRVDEERRFDAFWALEPTPALQHGRQAARTLPWPSKEIWKGSAKYAVSQCGYCAFAHTCSCVQQPNVRFSRKHISCEASWKIASCKLGIRSNGGLLWKMVIYADLWWSCLWDRGLWLLWMSNVRN